MKVGGGIEWRSCGGSKQGDLVDGTVLGVCWDAQSCQQPQRSRRGFVETTGQGCEPLDSLLKC